MDVETLISAIGVSVSILGFFYLIIRNKINDLLTFRVDIEKRLTLLETKITPFWNWVDRELPKILHSPHTPELDKLLEDYKYKESMSIDDLERLKCLINDEIKKTAKDKILLYTLFLMNLDLYIEKRIKDLP